MTQVIINLLSNAVKFSPARRARSWSRIENKGTTARITVRDHGPGMPEEYRDRASSRNSCRSMRPTHGRRAAPGSA